MGYPLRQEPQSEVETLPFKEAGRVGTANPLELPQIPARLIPARYS